ncbi:MAG: hypothetical protein QF752_04520 [Planctomycetota bacterium]|jgi:hypothetical protein|nr:hypothetical protein [Planctomycetota bacterium]
MRSGTLYLALIVALVAFSSVAVACPASYVKSRADQNKGTALHDKATKIADKYMTDRGMDPSSASAEVAKPYVIGTAIVEHDFSRWYSNSNPGDRIDLNKDSVDEATKKALGKYAGQSGVASSDGSGHGLYPAWHHFNRHFSYGIYRAEGLNPAKATGHGG